MTTEWPDVSHYQRGLSLRGAPLAFVKATQGTSYVDPEFGPFCAQGRQLGITVGGYHWLDTSDAVAQARHCFGVVGAGRPLMIDDEQPAISVPHTLAFVAEYRRLGGTVTLEYLPRWTWDASGRPDLRPLAAAGLLLVASDYNPSDNTAGGKARQPYGGVTPTVLQYTDKRPFNGQSVDFNTYPGSLPDLLTLISGGNMATGDADAKAPFIDMRVEAIAGLLPTYARVWTGVPVPFVVAFKQLVTDVATLKAGQAAESAAIAALAQQIQAGGGSVDVAAIQTAIQAATAGVKADVDAHFEALHKATQAQADALGQ